VLPGSGTAFPEYYAGSLAAHGYVAFGLAYIGIDPLPADCIEIPLEDVEKALDWLKRQPSVDAARVGIIGISKGAELTLLIASLRPRDFKAVVAVSGSSVVWEGYFHNSQAKDHSSMKPNRSSWSYHGEALPFVPKGVGPETRERAEREEAGRKIDFYASGYRDHKAVERATIAVEKIEAPTLLVASETDGAWNAAEMTRDVENRMRTHSRRCESLIYPDSAHQILDGWLPPNPGLPDILAGRSSDDLFAATREGTVHASMDSWRRIKSFFDANLRSRTAENIHASPSERKK
jgi:dipeptidyl aminopeptidase/acylaminoacyl peptidase